MQRFRLLRFYVIWVVAVVAFAIWEVSMRRTTADAGTPQGPQAGISVPSTANASRPRERKS
jgi:hypothetical protein